MQENSFEWFNAQVQDARNHADKWPPWMKNTSDVATVSFPVISGTEKKSEVIATVQQPLNQSEK
jgi:hypothetical protein